MTFCPSSPICTYLSVNHYENKVEPLTPEEIGLCDELKAALIEKFGSSRIPKGHITKKI